MGMAKKADGCVLIGEAGRRRQFVKNIAPALRTIEGGIEYSVN